jgi:hypothetical protein
MSYLVTYEPLIRMKGATAKIVERASATEAWASVLVLVANGEKTTVADPSGNNISQQELLALVDAEGS